jgi:class 3 adenylate cyclase/predicted ATPase
VTEFDEVLAQVLHVLQREGRVSYRALKLRFHLDDDYLEALKDEIIGAKQQAVDEESTVLVWTGGPDRLSVEPQPGSQPAQPATVTSQDAERRQLTVMFCDLVESTALSSQLDPEDYREVVRAYQATCAVIIQHYEGHIAQYLGDSLLVYCGYPRAHEDDAHRAIRIGLDIIEAVGTLNTRLEQAYGVRLAVRVGIHSGLVVIGEMGSGDRHELLAMGEAPNVASRVQAMAAPDTVVISAATYRLTRGAFVCEDLGHHLLKGVTAPVLLYRVRQIHDPESRFEAAALGLPPLVGRDDEMGLLQQRWEQSRDGQGQVVMVGGEAGIGKSRLVQALRQWVGSAGVKWILFRCSPYHTHSALSPVIACIQRLLQLRREDTPEEQLTKLEQEVGGYRFSPDKAVPLLAALLSVPLLERFPPLRLSPQQQRQQTLEILVAWLLEEAARQPMLAVWEDLHWADPSTLELLSLLMDQVPTARLMLLLTCRPELYPPWLTQVRVTQITLARLGQPQVEQIVAHLTQGKALPSEVLQHVIARTDGVPLFVEELVKTVLESGLVREEADHYALSGPLPPLAIPATLQDSLMARLDRLGTAREVAQLGATLGREFAYEVIQAVAPMEEATLQQGLGQLVEAELVYQRGLPPRARYVFKHALIQETAYQSLLKSTRQRYHQRIAQVLEVRFPEIVETQPELLAHHYTEAGLPAPALPYWQRAGQRAVEGSANLEAIQHLTKGLKLLQTLPETPERAQHELTLQLALGAPLLMIKGHTAAEVEQTYTRAYELCQQVGDSPQRFAALVGLWRFYISQAKLRTAHEVAEQGFLLAQRMQDPVLLQEAHLMLGSVFFYRGDLVSARAHLEQGIALYDPQQNRSLAFSGGTDPGVACLSWMAWTQWMLGYPDQGLARSREALSLAQELSHAYSRGFALHFAALFHYSRREVQLVQERTEAAIALSREQGFVRWLGGGMIMRGWALAEQGAVEEGIAQLRQGLSIWRHMGGELGLPHFFAMLADACGKRGQTEEVLCLLDEALAVGNKNEERRYEAELYRLKGEMLLQQDVLDEQQAETCFQHALDLARHQQAKSLELRAVMSLSRLWQRQSKRDAAHRLLTEIYHWYTEGLDTPDLQAARVLLEALA